MQREGAAGCRSRADGRWTKAVPSLRPPPRRPGSAREPLPSGAKGRQKRERGKVRAAGGGGGGGREAPAQVQPAGGRAGGRAGEAEAAGRPGRPPSRFPFGARRRLEAHVGVRRRRGGRRDQLEELFHCSEADKTHKKFSFKGRDLWSPSACLPASQPEPPWSRSATFSTPSGFSYTPNTRKASITQSAWLYCWGCQLSSSWWAFSSVVTAVSVTAGKRTVGATAAEALPKGRKEIR